MIALNICIAVFLFLLFNLFLAAFYAYRQAFYADRSRDITPYGRIDTKSHKPFKDEMRALIDRLVSLPCEKVYITARDGLKLSARYYHSRDGAPLVIMAHGYRGNSQRDFAGGADMFLKMGYNILLIEHRAHGDSEGKIITFGIKERFDIVDWAYYADKRFGGGCKIILAGISMGGACVLMALGEDLPDSVVGVLADCPYSSPLEIISHVGAGKGIAPSLVRFFARVGARVFAGFSLTSFSAIEAVKKAKLPILIIHGDADDFVPHSMSEELKAKNPSITLKTIPGADHAVAYLVDRDGYMREVEGFMNRILGGTNEN